MPIYTLTLTDGSTSQVAVQQGFYRTVGNALQAAARGLHARQRVEVKVGNTVIGIVYGSHFAAVDQISEQMSRSADPSAETLKTRLGLLQSAASDCLQASRTLRNHDLSHAAVVGGG